MARLTDEQVRELASEIKRDLKDTVFGVLALDLLDTLFHERGQRMWTRHILCCEDSCYPLETDPSTGEPICIKDDWTTDQWTAAGRKDILGEE